MAETIQAGDRVRLKSGSPVMTANAFHRATDQWICAWFEGNTHKEARFSAAALSKVADDDDGGPRIA